MSNLTDAVGARLHEIVSAGDSSDWEIVGRSVGERDQVTGRIEERARRIRGGWFDLFPELSDGPKASSSAIRKGKGKIYRRIVGQVTDYMRQFVPRERKKKPPSVPGHGSLTQKCKLCHVPHSKKQHRFHGRGAFHKTHLWGFRMNKARKNPAASMPLVYGQVKQVFAKKTQPHRCDAGCKKNFHQYYHDFKPGAKMWGLPAGSKVTLPDGRTLKIPLRSLLIAKSTR